MSEARRKLIVKVLGTELERQSREAGRDGPRLSGEFGDHVVFIEGQIDLGAMAATIDAALGGQAFAMHEVEEGRTPEELNAGNDD